MSIERGSGAKRETIREMENTILSNKKDKSSPFKEVLFSSFLESYNALIIKSMVTLTVLSRPIDFGFFS
jgi:hypothetical protein